MTEGTRQKLQKAISIVTRRASKGAPPNVNELAIKLSSKYPQSGMTLDEICAELTSRMENAGNQSDCRD